MSGCRGWRLSRPCMPLSDRSLSIITPPWSKSTWWLGHRQRILSGVSALLRPSTLLITSCLRADEPSPRLMPVRFRVARTTGFVAISSQRKPVSQATGFRGSSRPCQFNTLCHSRSTGNVYNLGDTRKYWLCRERSAPNLQKAGHRVSVRVIAVTAVTGSP